MSEFDQILGMNFESNEIWGFFGIRKPALEAIDLEYVEEDEGFNFEVQDKGLSLVFEGAAEPFILHHCWLYTSDYLDCVSDYTGKFPKNLKFGLSRNEIEEALGAPTSMVDLHPNTPISDKLVGSYQYYDEDAPYRLWIGFNEKWESNAFVISISQDAEPTEQGRQDIEDAKNPAAAIDRQVDEYVAKGILTLEQGEKAKKELKDLNGC